jgi:hypothetical protein
VFQVAPSLDALYVDSTMGAAKYLLKPLPIIYSLLPPPRQTQAQQQAGLAQLRLGLSQGLGLGLGMTKPDRAPGIGAKLVGVVSDEPAAGAKNAPFLKPCTVNLNAMNYDDHSLGQLVDGWAP